MSQTATSPMMPHGIGIPSATCSGGFTTTNAAKDASKRNFNFTGTAGSQVNTAPTSMLQASQHNSLDNTVPAYSQKQNSGNSSNSLAG